MAGAHRTRAGVAVGVLLATWALGDLGRPPAAVATGGTTAHLAAQDVPPCAGGVPFPPDVSIDPPPSGLSQNLAAYLGAWHGTESQQMGGSLASMDIPAQLAVDRIDDRSARVVLGWGGSAWSSPYFSRRTLQVQPDGRLAEGSGSLTLALASDQQSVSGRLVSANRAQGSERQALANVSTALSLTRCRLIQATPAEGPGRVLLRDDFGLPTSGWPRESSEPARRELGFRDGTYVVVRQAEAGGTQGASIARRFGDAFVEIDVRVAPPTDDAFVVVQIRRRDDGSGSYVFQVDPNQGELRVFRF